MAPRPDALVWVKLRGFPWWPAKVARPAEAPANVLKGKRKKDSVLVCFFPKGDFTWLPDSNVIKPFSCPEMTKLVNQKQGAQLSQAIRMASGEHEALNASTAAPSSEEGSRGTKR